VAAGAVSALSHHFSLVSSRGGSERMRERRRRRRVKMSRKAYEKTKKISLKSYKIVVAPIVPLHIPMHKGVNP